MTRTTTLSRPQALANQPRAPQGMPAEGKALWDRVVRTRPSGQWNPGDSALIELYVKSVLDIEKCETLLEKQGVVIRNRFDTLVMHPLVNVRAQRERVMLACTTKLRLAPNQRYSATTAGRLSKFANKAAETQALLDSDDLLAGTKGPLQ